MGSILTNGVFLPAEGERNCYEGLAANWTALDGMIGGYNVHISNTTIHVTAEDKATWNGKADASALTAHTGNTTIHVTAEDKQAWNGKADASALTAHTGDTTIHVTAEDKQAWDGHVADTTIHVTSADKQAWNGKADASALTAHTGDTTIHVTAADKQTWNGHVADSVKHVTAEDKAAWNGKADASALTAHTGDTTIHVTAEDKQAWDGHVADSVKHVTAEDKAKWDAVTSKANDSDVVHKSGDETVAGFKEFANIRLNNSIKGINLDSTTTDLNNCYSDFAPSDESRGGNIQYYYCNTISGTANISNLPEASAFFLTSFTTRLTSNALYVKQILISSSSKTFVRYCRSYNWSSWVNETDSEYVHKSGSETISGNKTFSSINGVEPSSLSLPSDRSARIDISSYFTNTGTGQSNSYTVPANGYIYLTLSELTNVHCFSCSSGNVTNYAQTFTKPSNSTGALYVLFPVRKNDVFVATWYTTTTVSVDGAFFIPCQGNI